MTLHSLSAITLVSVALSQMRYHGNRLTDITVFGSYTEDKYSSITGISCITGINCSCIPCISINNLPYITSISRATSINSSYIASTSCIHSNKYLDHSTISCVVIKGVRAWMYMCTVAITVMCVHILIPTDIELPYRV